MASPITGPTYKPSPQRALLRDVIVLAAAVTLIVVCGSWIAVAGNLVAAQAGAERGTVAASSALSAAAPVASPSPAPGGDVDGDPDDWSGAPLVIGAVVVAAAIVGGGVLVAWRRTRRRERS